MRASAGMISFREWREPAGPIAPSKEAVHVWRARLGVGSGALDRYEGYLSPPEREQLHRYRVARKRREYAVTRGLLRELLGAALEVDPRGVELAYGDHGKPYLAGPDPGRVTFNVSHSHELALIALSAGREIGVDVEKVRSRVAYRKVAERFFSPAEVAGLMTLPERERQAGFFNCWTRKEAVIKAVGRGIGLGLARFDVTLAPGAPAALVETRWGPDEAARWSLLDLTVGTGYAGAIAVAGHGFEIHGWDNPE